MAVKKLYTENYIRDIANSLRTVTGGTDTYTTQEMAATLATIHRGAKDVWIGDQIAYNSLSSYDAEICYIIFDNNKVMRVYAGTVILYDDPVVWDYSLPTHTFTGTPSGMIDTGIELFSSENINRPFEMYVHISDYADGMRFIGAIDDYAHGGTGQGFYLWTDIPPNMRFGGTTRPEFLTGPINCNYRIRRDTYKTLYIYDLDDNETLVYTSTFASEALTDVTFMLGGNGNLGMNAYFTLHDFRFRWLDT